VSAAVKIALTMHTLPEVMATLGMSQLLRELRPLLPSTPVAQVVQRHVRMSPCEFWNPLTDFDETLSYCDDIEGHNF
jgi:hypothetical protein